MEDTRIYICTTWRVCKTPRQGFGVTLPLLDYCRASDEGAAEERVRQHYKQDKGLLVDKVETREALIQDFGKYIYPVKVLEA